MPLQLFKEVKQPLMATFLDTQGVSAELSKTIGGAQDSLILISPYLKINEQMRQLLQDRSMMKIPIHVVYGKSELQADEKAWLDSQRYIHTQYRPNLHAKIYLNEKQAIVTSMNLYEFSQQNNTEAGILVRQEEDEELFAAIKQNARFILNTSEETTPSSKPAADRKEPSPSSKAASGKKTGGSRQTPEKKAEPAPAATAHCLRDGQPIPFSMKQPYCAKCFKSWSRYEDKDYEEKYCHGCGKEQKSSMAKPLCGKCFHRMTASR